MDASVLAKNPVLAAISSGGLGYSIYCHDALFIGNDASLTEEEEMEARNDLNGILAQQPRMLTDSEGEMQVVSVGQMYFKTTDDVETELVPAYTPSYSSIDGRTISVSNLGPSMFLEMQMRFVDKEKWVDPQRKKNTTPLEIVVPCDGTFVFASAFAPSPTTLKSDLGRRSRSLSVSWRECVRTEGLVRVRVRAPLV